MNGNGMMLGDVRTCTSSSARLPRVLDHGAVWPGLHGSAGLLVLDGDRGSVRADARTPGQRRDREHTLVSSAWDLRGAVAELTGGIDAGHIRQLLRGSG